MQQCYLARIVITLDISFTGKNKKLSYRWQTMWHI